MLRGSRGRRRLSRGADDALTRLALLGNERVGIPQLPQPQVVVPDGAREARVDDLREARRGDDVRDGGRAGSTVTPSIDLSFATPAVFEVAICWSSSYHLAVYCRKPNRTPFRTMMAGLCASAMLAPAPV